MTAAEYVAGLREFADWVEQHPNLAEHLSKPEVRAYPLDNSTTVKEWARAMPKPVEKEYADTLFRLKSTVGSVVDLTTVFYRETVCRKVVTTEEVTTLVPDPTFEAPAVPMVEQTETVERVKWICDEPLLAAVPDPEPVEVA